MSIGSTISRSSYGNKYILVFYVLLFSILNITLQYISCFNFGQLYLMKGKGLFLCTQYTVLGLSASPCRFHMYDPRHALVMENN